ncbi:Vegetative incompatibility protein HET-E-1 [Cladobotryum mycophilum]|uniref:Vegetative incompatibility protein HET-E-1 n=1 Tax=Cladobotryum mycophilum TaxID=491253 RepID=A0ABR0S7B1_9HYPO
MAPSWVKKLCSRKRDSRRSTPEPSAASTSHEPKVEIKSQEQNASHQKPGADQRGQDVSNQEAEAVHQAPGTNEDPKIASPSIQERLWNQAYEQAKVSDADVVEAYEKIISLELPGQPQSPIDTECPSNQIDPTPDKRRQQMQIIVQAGLERTKMKASIEQRIGKNLKTFGVVRKTMDQAVRSAPEAAVAWVGICFTLEMLSNPITEARINREGIAYVVSRMDWYWHLSDLLLNVNRGEAWSMVLQTQLEKHIVDLYQQLLLYQMKSVCLYHRHGGVAFLRDMIKLDDWDDQLNNIRNAEALVNEDSRIFNTSAIRTQLDSIVSSGDGLQKELKSILSAIEDHKAQQQEIQRTEKEEECLKDMRVTDPQLDKTRIENTNGGLLQDSYIWVVKDKDFVYWRDHPESRLLWIKGDPGKGKTMLVCGIINELQTNQSAKPYYFFCQATDDRLNNATGVLCGLIYSIACEHQQALSFVMEKYKHAGKDLFRDVNSWTALSAIFTCILQDPSLKEKVFMIDALDECVKDRPLLLDFIAQASAKFEAKWIVSSRNWTSIEEKLQPSSQRTRLSLEINEQSISDAVRVYVEHKVDQLAKLKKLDDATRAGVQDHLSTNANGTFLWVALVYKELSKEDVNKRHMLKTVKMFPPDLEPLYARMMKQVHGLQDADLCKQVLGLISLVYRPISLVELASLVKTPEAIDDLDELRDVVAACGSFLVLKNDVVYFVHQSAKDFLLNRASDQIFASGIAYRHYDIFLRSLEILSKTLRRDIYNLRHPGALMSKLYPPNPDPLAPVRYSCVFWVDHLRGASSYEMTVCGSSLQDEGVAHTFLKAHFLHWLEGLSLLKTFLEGVRAIRTLEALTTNKSGLMGKFIKDAHRFVLSFRLAIESAPLQTYTSALIFAPTSSTIRETFETKYSPGWIIPKPSVQSEWNACLQTLEGHEGWVRSVLFSPDGTQLASASYDGTVKIWDRVTGACLRTLRHGVRDYDGPEAVAFSPNGMQLASASENSIKIWNPAKGACLMTFARWDGRVNSMVFSVDGTQLMSSYCWKDESLQVWDPVTGVGLEKHHCYPGVESTVCSEMSTGEESTSARSTLKIRDPIRGSCVQIVTEDPEDFCQNVAFSPDSSQLALADGKTLLMLNAATGVYVQKLEEHTAAIESLTFSRDGARLASGSDDRTIKIWATATGACLQTLEGHTDIICSVAFSPDGTQLASASDDNTIKIWDLALGSAGNLQKSEGHQDRVRSVTYSSDNTRVASGSEDCTIKIWDPTTGACLQTLQGHDRAVFMVIWDLTTGTCQHTFENTEYPFVHSMAFSPNGARLALASSVGYWNGDGAIIILDAINGTHIHELHPASKTIAVVFSSDSMRLGSASEHGTVHIWDPATGTCLHRLKISVKLASQKSWLKDLRTLQLQRLVANLLQEQDSAYELRHEFEFTEDRTWLLRRGQPFLWLPLNYRPYIMTFSGELLTIGSESGPVFFFRLFLADLDTEMAEV